MIAVISIVAPIFFLIFVGYMSVRYGAIPQASIPSLSRFVLYLALPSLIFTKLSAMELRDVLHFDYIAVYALGGFSTFIITVCASAWLLKSNWADAGVRGIGAMLPNSAFIGFPVLLQVFDASITQALVMALLVENLLFLPVSLIFIESMMGRKEHPGGKHFLMVFKRILINPLLISLVVGLVFSFFGWRLPNLMQDGFQLLANAAPAVSLIVIGGSLVGVTIKGQWSPILLVALGKLIVFPVIVSLFLMLTPALPNELKVAVIIIASVSMFSAYPIVCGEYGARSFCASTLLVTTILSFFTLSILLRFLV